MRNSRTRRRDDGGRTHHQDRGRAGARYCLCGGARQVAGKVTALRDDAFKRFDARGLPHRRVEEWKYTDLRALMRDAKPLAGPAGAKPKGGITTILTGVDVDFLAIV